MLTLQEVLYEWLAEMTIELGLPAVAVPEILTPESLKTHLDQVREGIRTQMRFPRERTASTLRSVPGVNVWRVEAIISYQCILKVLAGNIDDASILVENSSDVTQLPNSVFTDVAAPKAFVTKVRPA